MDIPPVNTHMKEILTMKKTVAKLLLLSVILTGILTGLGIIRNDSNNNNGSVLTCEDETDYNCHK